jgi:molybdopterin-guanine dinucleotide biosynthesis protein A
VVRALAAGAEGVDAAVPQTGPLPGAYRRTALPALEHRIATGELALYRALADLRVSTVNIDVAFLGNVNSPGDLTGLR